MFRYEKNSLEMKKGKKRFQRLMGLWVELEVHIETHVKSNGSVSRLNKRLFRRTIKKLKRICNNKRFDKYYRNKSFEWLLYLLITKKINDFNRMELEQLYNQKKLSNIFEDFKSFIFKIIKIRREIDPLNNNGPLILSEIITNIFTALNIIIESEDKEMLENRLELISNALDSISARVFPRGIPFRQISLFLSSMCTNLIGIKAREFEMRQMNAFRELFKKVNLI